MTIQTIEDLQKFIPQFLEHAGATRKVLLRGEMGVGKTAFVQALGQHLGVKEKIQSPTYALINEYSFESEKGQVCAIYHMDLYRLKSLEEAIDIGIEDYLYNDNWCFIEWPDLIKEIWPTEYVVVDLKLNSDNSRQITLS